MAEISISKVKVSWFLYTFFHLQLPARREHIQAGMLHAVLPHPVYTVEWAAGVQQKAELGMWKGRTYRQGRAQRKKNMRAGWVGDTILRDDFPALDQYSSTDISWEQVKFDSRKGIGVD